MNIPFRYVYTSSGMISDDHCGEGNISMHVRKDIGDINQYALIRRSYVGQY